MLTDLVLALLNGHAKRCTKCGEVKLLGEFAKNKARRDGLNSRCRSCCAVAFSTYAESNRERLLECKARYRVENRDLLIERSRKYEEANRDKRNARKRERASTPEARAAAAERNRTWRSENATYLSNYTRQYNAKNKDRRAAVKKLWDERMKEEQREKWAARYYANPEKYRARSRALTRNNPESVKRRNRALVDEIHPNYAKQCLAKNLGVKCVEVPAEFIEMKRQLLKAKRTVRAVTNHLKGIDHE